MFFLFTLHLMMGVRVPCMTPVSKAAKIGDPDG